MIRDLKSDDRARICALLDNAPVILRWATTAQRTTLGELLRHDDELWSERAAVFAALWGGGVYRVGGGASPRVAIVRP